MGWSQTVGIPNERQSIHCRTRYSKCCKSHRTIWWSKPHDIVRGNKNKSLHTKITIKMIYHKSATEGTLLFEATPQLLSSYLTMCCCQQLFVFKTKLRINTFYKHCLFTAWSTFYKLRTDGSNHDNVSLPWSVACGRCSCRVGLCAWSHTTWQQTVQLSVWQCIKRYLVKNVCTCVWPNKTSPALQFLTNHLRYNYVFGSPLFHFHFHGHLNPAFVMSCSPCIIVLLLRGIILSSCRL